MAKRFTDTEIWDREWFMALAPKLKCLVRFMFDKCDAAGVWAPNWSLASTYIGEKIVEADLSLLNGQVKKMKNGKFFIVGFIEFQYGKLSENCKPHLKVISLLKKHDLYDTLYLNAPKGIHTLEEKETEEEKEKEKEGEGAEGGLIVPVMLEKFKQEFPNYFPDKHHDFPALRQIAEKIQKEQKLPYDLLKNSDKILRRWGELVQHIKGDKHYVRYSLSQVNKHFQSIIQSSHNAVPSKSKSDGIMAYVTRGGA